MPMIKELPRKKIREQPFLCMEPYENEGIIDTANDFQVQLLLCGSLFHLDKCTLMDGT